MKTWTMMASMLVMALVVGVAHAEEKKAPKEGRAMAKRVGGTITAVDEKSISVQPGDAAKPVVKVALTETTKVKIDSKEAKASDLKPGQKVVVVLDADGTNAVAVNVGDMKGHGEGRH